MQKNNKRIFVNSLSFDLDNQYPNGDLQDAYLLHFLNEAVDDEYEVIIFVDENNLDALRSTIEIAAGNCFDLLGEDVDWTIFDDSIVTNEEIPLIEIRDLSKDDGRNDLLESINPLGDFELVIVPEDKLNFTGLLDHYVTYRSPDTLNSMYAFKEYKETINDDTDLRDSIESDALESANNQIIMIRDNAFLSKFFKGDHERELAKIGRNKNIYNFCNSQSFTFETPGYEKPSISAAEFYLTHYFANLLRLQNPNMRIHESSFLQNRNKSLAQELSKVRGGDRAVAEIQSFADTYSKLKP